MRHNQVIYLVSITTTEDDIGNQVETSVERMVYANELSVGSGEFYNAALAGLRATKRFEVYSFEYLDEPKLKHNNITYRIIGTEAKGEKLRITCERVGADG